MAITSFQLPCGHRCSLTCHADACLPEPECAYVVNASCPCKRIKKAFICSNWQQRNARLDCDDVCQRKKEKDLKVSTAAESIFMFYPAFFLLSRQKMISKTARQNLCQKVFFS